MHTTTITVCMSGSYRSTRDAFDRHNLPTREIVEIVGGGPQCTLAKLPDSPEVREKLQGLANVEHASLLAVSVTTLYPQVDR